MLGAGLNRAISDRKGVSPPLIDDFFQVTLDMEEYGLDQRNKSLQPLYDYIQKYWGKDKHSLASTPFDIEECFTLLELQQLDEIRKKNIPEAKRLHDIYLILSSRFYKTISRFEPHVGMSQSMRSFGELLYREQPCILTFNYDCFVETAIESASRIRLDEPKDYLYSLRGSDNPPSDDLIAYSFHKWNRPLGYGLKFDEVELHHPGVSERVGKERFYSHPENILYPWPILKLHGSLNWFRHWALISGSEEEKSLTKEEKKQIESQIILHQSLSDSDYPEIEYPWMLAPIIITPILHKDSLIQSIPVYRHTFDTIWTKAREALSNCRKLVVIGYSFPPTDFLTKKLILESFSEHSLEELIVVNPDTSICRRIKELCHFKRPVTLCANLDEFLSITKKMCLVRKEI